MRFRKKPVVIEAIQFKGTRESATEVLKWANSLSLEHRYVSVSPGHIMVIETLEGTMRAHQNDWIIKGVNGEFYPCKPDIFEKTYEPVDGE